jgi:tetratricopeptide (TPR) repeat protein
VPMVSVAYRLLITSLLTLASASVYAQRDRDTYSPGNQSFEVAGQANIAGTNSPAANVTVRLERFSGGIIDQVNTDERGRFRFGNLQRGYYRVIINAPRFAPAQQDADLSLLFKAYLVFSLASTGSGGSPGSTIDVIDARVPATARAEFTRGREALGRKAYKDAVVHFQKAIMVYPEFFQAHFLLGTTFVDQREWDKAESEYLSALAIKPDSPPAMLALGEVYWREKRYDEAEKILLEGLKLEERNWHGHFTLSRLYWDKGDVMKAGPEIGRTLQLKPDFAEAHLLAGNILLRLNQPQRAQVEYEEYLRLAPKGEYAGQARNLLRRLQDTPPEQKQ